MLLRAIDTFRRFGELLALTQVALRLRSDRRSAIWLRCSDLRTRNGLEDGDLLGEAFQRILPLHVLQFCRRVLVNKLVNRKVAAADTHINLVLIDSDIDLACAEFVGALGLAHEHDFKFLTIWVVVNVLGQSLVDGIAFDWDVDCDSRLQINNVLL